MKPYFSYTADGFVIVAAGSLSKVHWTAVRLFDRSYVVPVLTFRREGLPSREPLREETNTL